MTAIILLIALAGAPPAIDLASICRSAQAAALPEDKAAAYDSYSPAAQAACAGSGGVTLSYVELLTCLEMQPGGSLSLQYNGAASSGAGVAPLERSPKVEP
ncbi:MAG: hypothetical protein ABSC22_14425 [Roseiarcus sp.]